MKRREFSGRDEDAGWDRTRVGNTPSDDDDGEDDDAENIDDFDDDGRTRIGNEWSDNDTEDDDADAA